jgi:hypothetical protein
MDGNLSHLQHLHFKHSVESIHQRRILGRTIGNLMRFVQFMLPNDSWAMRRSHAMVVRIAVPEELTFAKPQRDAIPIENRKAV